MPNRATKQETELRVAHAAELVAEGQAYYFPCCRKIWNLKKKSKRNHIQCLPFAER